MGHNQSNCFLRRAEEAERELEELKKRQNSQGNQTQTKPLNSSRAPRQSTTTSDRSILPALKRLVLTISSEKLTIGPNVNVRNNKLHDGEAILLIDTGSELNLLKES